MPRNFGLRDKHEQDLEAALRKAAADLLDYSRANGISIEMTHDRLGSMTISIMPIENGISEAFPAEQRMTNQT
jgi:hypothetical protein